MKKYQWDLLVLREKIDALETKEQTYTSFEAMETYRMLLKMACGTINESFDSVNVKKELAFLQKICHKKRELLVSVDPLIDFFDDFITMDFGSLKRVRLSNKDVISLALDIIKDFDINYFLEAEAFLREGTTSLHYGSTFDSEYQGLTTIVDDGSSKDIYTQVLRNNTLMDVVTLVHELFHVIRERRKGSSHFTSTLFRETEGFFADYLAVDFLKKLGLDSNIDSVLYNDYCVTATSSDVFKSLQSANNYYINKDIDLAAHFLFDAISLESDFIDDVPYDERNCYSSVECFYFSLERMLSFAACNDLYFSYQKDRDKSKYNFERVLNFRGGSLDDYLKLGGYTFKDDHLLHSKQFIKMKLKEKDD